jgi:hypothetical protein
MRLTLPRITIVVFLVLIEVIAFGCYGWGSPTSAGTHRFRTFDAAEAFEYEVWDPPAVGAPFAGKPDSVEAAQLSPDGQWLYLVVTGPCSFTIARVGARQQQGVLRADVAIHGECNITCAACGGIQGTRVHLSPSIDPQHPPAIEVNGTPVEVQPWLP